MYPRACGALALSAFLEIALIRQIMVVIELSVGMLLDHHADAMDFSINPNRRLDLMARGV
jgi:hypothetical protein